MTDPRSPDEFWSPPLPPVPETTGSRRWWSGWLAVYGLGGFAVAVPLFRVLGPSPEFFVAHRVGQIGVVWFAVLVAVVGPATVATVATAAGRVSPWLRGMFVAVLGALAAAGALQPLAGLGAFPMLVVVAGVLFAAHESRGDLARTTATVLAVATLASAVWFVGLSRTSTYVFADDAELVAVNGTAAGDLAPVVVIVFDEFPATALVGSDLRVNEERFPNFARLADQSDWYRLASSVSPWTGWSVPALLSGTSPTGEVGVASNYPSNLFLQLGGLYETFAYEPVTGLCPDEVCGGAPVRTAQAVPPPDRTSTLLSDSLVVFRHAVGSDAMRGSLPPIDHSWSGFDTSSIELVEVGADPEAGEYMELGDDATFVGTSLRLRTLMAQRPTGDRPPLYVAHIIAPHLPYLTNPSGSVYANQDLVGLETHDLGLTWPMGVDEAARRQGYQRFLLQLGGVDTVLGEVIDDLERDGLWDEAAVVVTADHGASFEEGYFRDATTAGAEVWNVPLFVKRPGQRDGRVRDEAALTIDAVPTLLAILGLESPTTFDGVDLDSGPVPSIRENAFNHVGTTITIDQSVDAVRDVVTRRADWIDPDGGWPAVYKVGPGGDLVGSPVPAGVIVDGGTWRTDPSLGGVPTVRRLRLDLNPAQAAPAGVIVAAGDRIVGTGAPLVATGDGTYDVTVVVDEETAMNGLALDVYTVGADTTLRRLTPGDAP